MLRTLTAWGWWAWRRKDQIEKVIEYGKKIYAAETTREQVMLALDILDIGVLETKTDKDDMVVRALRKFTENELFDLLVATVDDMIQREQSMMRSPADPVIPQDVSALLVARMNDAALAHDTKAATFAMDAEVAFAAGDASDDEIRGNPMVIIGVASLVVQLIRWFQDRKRD